MSGELRVNILSNEAGNGAPTISYDNSISGLDATTIKSALDLIPTLPSKPHSGQYTLEKLDKGKHVSLSGTGNITVPVDIFDVGEVVVVYNNTTTTKDIVRESGVSMYWYDGVDEDRQVLQRGLVSFICVGVNEFLISGQGVV